MRVSTAMLPKPRLRLKYGIWGCVSMEPGRGLGGFTAGYGYKPEVAYKEWRKRWELTQS